jgi:hypothetical protein
LRGSFTRQLYAAALRGFAALTKFSEIKMTEIFIVQAKATKDIEGVFSNKAELEAAFENILSESNLDFFFTSAKLNFNLENETVELREKAVMAAVAAGDLDRANDVLFFLQNGAFSSEAKQAKPQAQLDAEKTLTDRELRAQAAREAPEAPSSTISNPELETDTKTTFNDEMAPTAPLTPTS